MYSVWAYRLVCWGRRDWFGYNFYKVECLLLFGWVGRGGVDWGDVVLFSWVCLYCFLIMYSFWQTMMSQIESIRSTNILHCTKREILSANQVNGYYCPWYVVCLFSFENFKLQFVHSQFTYSIKTFTDKFTKNYNENSEWADHKITRNKVFVLCFNTFDFFAFFWCGEGCGESIKDLQTFHFRGFGFRGFVFLTSDWPQTTS